MNLVLRGPVAELRDVVVAEAVVVPVALDAVDDLYVFFLAGKSIFPTYSRSNANITFRREMMHLLPREPQRLPPPLTLRFYH